MAGGKDRGKAAGKEPPASEESVDGDTEETLALAVEKIQGLVNSFNKEIEVLAQIAKSNKKAVEVNSASIKDLERNVKDNKT